MVVRPSVWHGLNSYHDYDSRIYIFLVRRWYATTRSCVNSKIRVFGSFFISGFDSTKEVPSLGQDKVCDFI